MESANWPLILYICHASVMSPRMADMLYAAAFAHYNSAHVLTTEMHLTDLAGVPPAPAVSIMCNAVAVASGFHSISTDSKAGQVFIGQQHRNY